ncbi:protein argonaute 4-like isoform X2 [Rutidosis leptorrhynchoides]|uniref:protein argonaute 4-like isoform X2 n=1 Tax=Rutidosis leptorrhynchoides TaxID=125765 RepID=UPI003A994C9B
MDSENGNTGVTDALPPPPPVTEDVVPIKAEPEPVKKKVMRVPMARRSLATKGQKAQLLTNHFKVNVSNVDGHFFHYSVALFYEDGRPTDGKGIGRKVLDKVHETYRSELDGKEFAYDGEKSLFTVGALPRNKLEFTIVLDNVTSNRNNGNASPDNDADKKRVRRSYQSKTFKVELSFAAKIPMQAIAQALRGQESENSQEALRVLDIILRQHAAKQGCLLVRQSFFHNDVKNFADVGGGVLGCRGFHSSFRTSKGGLSLNIDVSTTMIIQPGPVIDFLIANQNVTNPLSIDWAKAKRTLKNLRIKNDETNAEYKITGLSEKPCNQQLFSLRQKSKDDNGEFSTDEITVQDYFVNIRKVNLRYSAELPCINVGKPKKPIFLPIEFCSLVSLQRYTKSLNTMQRASLVEKSRQKPQERMRVLTDALKLNNYDAEPLLKSCGISISNNFTQVEGRVLPAPKLKVGNGEDFFPRNGRWNFNNKKLVDPTTITKWAVVNFSARCDIRKLVRDLIKCGGLKGIKIEDPFEVFEESPQNRRAPPLVRVEKMFEYIKSKLAEICQNRWAPQFLLCLLPERKNSDLYGPWKKTSLADYGTVTQCIAPMKVNDQYLTNVLLKINAKLGGLNSKLAVEVNRSIPIVSKSPTIILGMDVSHGQPGQSDVPSIAAVVSSRHYPLISRYRASVRTQSPKVEMIDSLFKKVSDTEDEGIMRELLLDYYVTSAQRKPEQIIIFRDGVSESQFSQVLNIELDQIIEACKFLDENWCPKFLVIIAQKNHHTKFFQPGSPDNVPPGTVIDNKVCHPRNNDFYMCAHAGMILMIFRSLYTLCHMFTREAPPQFLLLHLFAMLI